MKPKVSSDLWIIIALFLFTFVVAYLSSLQGEICLDLTQKPGAWELTSWPLKVALFQLLAALGLLIFTLSRRFAAPVSLVEEQGRVQSEYVVSMGQLLQRAEDRARIVETLAGQFRYELCRKLALSAKTTKNELVQILNMQHPKIAGRVKDVFAEADEFQGPQRERDLIGMIRWARKISAVRQEWRQGS